MKKFAIINVNENKYVFSYSSYGVNLGKNKRFAVTFSTIEEANDVCGKLGSSEYKVIIID